VYLAPVFSSSIAIDGLLVEIEVIAVVKP